MDKSFEDKFVLSVLLLCHILLFALIFFLISGSSLNLFQEANFSSTFDYLAKSLSVGSADVPKESIKWEGFYIGSKVYTYFGLWPAVIRAPLNLLFPKFFGRWSLFSILFAFLIVNFFLVSLFRYASKKSKYEYLNKNSLSFALFVSLILILQTPILFLFSSARIFHEPIIWGLAGCSAFIYFLFRYYDEPSPKLYFYLCIAFLVTILSRLTFALPQITLLTFLALRILFKNKFSLNNLSILFLSGTPALAAIAIQMWYNYARFGSVLINIDYTNYQFNPDNFGGTFNLQRLPINFINYFFPSKYNFISEFPYFVVSKGNYLGNSNLYMEWRETVVPLLLSCPLVLFFGFSGVVKAIKSCQYELLTTVLSFLIQIVFILMFYFVTQRYEVELIVILIFGIAFLIRSSLDFKFIDSRYAKTFLVLVGVLSILVNINSVFQWQVVYADDSEVNPKLKYVLSPLTTSKDLALEKKEPIFFGYRFRGIYIDPKRVKIFKPSEKRGYLVPNFDATVSATIAYTDLSVRCDNSYGKIVVRNQASGEVIFQSIPISVYTPVKKISFSVPAAKSRSELITIEHEQLELPWKVPGNECKGEIGLIDLGFQRL